MLLIGSSERVEPPYPLTRRTGPGPVLRDRAAAGRGPHDHHPDDGDEQQHRRAGHQQHQPAAGGGQGVEHGPSLARQWLETWRTTRGAIASGRFTITQ